MNSDQIEALADRIIALINAQLRSPTRTEIVNAILSINCDPALVSGMQVPCANTHTLTTGQMSSHGGGAVWGPSDPGSPALTMADVLKIATEEAARAAKDFAYADIRFSAKLDPHTDNVMVVAERRDDQRAALAFAFTRKSLWRYGHEAALRDTLSIHCFLLGESVLCAGPELALQN